MAMVLRNHQRFKIMLFPRLYALSEVVWTPKNKKDYTDFVSRLESHLKRSAQENVNYSQSFE